MHAQISSHEPHRKLNSTSAGSSGQQNFEMQDQSIQVKWPDNMSTKSRRRSLTSRVSLVLVTVVFLSVAMLLVGPYFGLHPQRLVYKQPHLHDQVGILLHSKTHSNRDAETLRFDWTVTTGTRSPDGVEKQVYLVNGKSPRPVHSPC